MSSMRARARFRQRSCLREFSAVVGEFLCLGAGGGLRFANAIQRSMQLTGETHGWLHIRHALITGRHCRCLQLTDDAFNTLNCHDSPLDGFLRA
jgi:hypothetical protein